MSGKKEKLKRQVERIVTLGLRLGWTKEEIVKTVARLEATK